MDGEEEYARFRIEKICKEYLKVVRRTKVEESREWRV